MDSIRFSNFFPIIIIVLFGGGLILLSWWRIRRSWIRLKEGSKSLFDVFNVFFSTCTLIGLVALMFVILRFLLFDVPMF